MGMDFKYAGSKSYPRFDRELIEVAKVFGGAPSNHLKDEMDSQVEGSIEWWFGSLGCYSLENVDKFVFPQDTDSTLVKWFNNPYRRLNDFDTQVVGKFILSHIEIKDISPQLYAEFEYLLECEDNWHIS